MNKNFDHHGIQNNQKFDKLTKNQVNSQQLSGQNFTDKMKYSDENALTINNNKGHKVKPQKVKVNTYKISNKNSDSMNSVNQKSFSDYSFSAAVVTSANVNDEKSSKTRYVNSIKRFV